MRTEQMMKSSNFFGMEDHDGEGGRAVVMVVLR